MQNREWHSLLPADLLETAYKSTNELAWPEEQALQVIEILNANGLTATAVEPWLPTKPGPTPLTFDWHLCRRTAANKFPDTAAEFIKQFDKLYPVSLEKGQVPVFNLSAEPKAS